MKRIVKKLAYSSGVFNLSSRMNRKTLSILLYHGVCPHSNSNLLNEEKHIVNAEFEQHLNLITKYCTPISLESAILGQKLPPNPIVLTFDDGYRNNYTDAFPMLKKYNVPATIFVTTGFIDKTNYMWPDVLEYIIEHTRMKTLNLKWDDSEFRFDLNTDEKKITTITATKNYLKSLTEQDRLRFIDALQEKLEIEYSWRTIPPIFSPLTWDEIREMRNSGLISIGSHTVSHPILARCSYQQQHNELALSQRRITEELGGECILFAYPNGQSADYTQQTVELLDKCGYKIAVTTVFGYVDTENRDNFHIKRFGRGMDIEGLGAVITGLSRLMSKFNGLN